MSRGLWLRLPVPAQGLVTEVRRGCAQRPCTHIATWLRQAQGRWPGSGHSGWGQLPGGCEEP